MAQVREKLKKDSEEGGLIKVTPRQQETASNVVVKEAPVVSVSRYGDY